MIAIRNAVKQFGVQKVLDGLSFEVKSGEIVCLLGRSGAGKSVLLKCIVGLGQLDAGEICVDEFHVGSLNERDLFSLRRQCAMVFQQPALLDSLTVFENIGFGLEAERLDEETEKIRVESAVRRVGLELAVLPEYPLNLSFGAQKRISIARVLALNPKYFLFDEPTTGLDPVVTRSLNHLIQTIVRGTDRSALVVSHDVESALEIADRIILLQDGHQVFWGTPGEFITSNQPLAVQFKKYGRWS